MKALTGLPTPAYVRAAEEAKIQLADLLKLVQSLEAGSSPAYLARYRPDIAAGLDEIQIRAIEARLRQFLDLEERRITVLAALSQQERLTPELRERIEGTLDRRELEDLFQPYKPKRRSEADQAVLSGLEPLARLLWEQAEEAADPAQAAASFVKPEEGVATPADALAGARRIIARWLGEDAECRRGVRPLAFEHSFLVVKPGSRPPKKDADRKRWDSLRRFREPVRKISWRQMLAIRRGHRDEWLRYEIELPENRIVEGLLSRLLLNPRSLCCLHLGAAAVEAYQRYLRPQFYNEVIQDLKERCDARAIDSFQKNLRKLLITPPAGPMALIGLETGRPGGWRAAVVGANGEFITGGVVEGTGEQKGSGGGEQKEEKSGAEDGAASSESGEQHRPADSQAQAQESASGQESAPEQSPEGAPQGDGQASGAAASAEVRGPSETAAKSQSASAGEDPASNNTGQEPAQEEGGAEPAQERPAGEQPAAGVESGSASGETPSAQAASSGNAPSGGNSESAAPVKPEESGGAAQPEAEQHAGTNSQTQPQGSEQPAGGAQPESQAAATSEAAESPGAETSAEPARDRDAGSEQGAAAQDGAAKPGEAPAGKEKTPKGGKPKQQKEKKPEKPEPVVKLSELVQQHSVQGIVYGNGPGIRQVERVVRDAIREAGAPKVFWTSVSEAGTWIYATSKAARRELPELSGPMRSAVSLARRLQDPMDEMLKVEPRVLGIGQFHHDVDQKRLRSALRATAEYCAHQTGADLNRSSPPLLALTPGFTERLARRVADHRSEHGRFSRREQVRQVTGLNDKIFQTAAGFLRIRDAEDPLETTGVHPEHYPLVEKLLAGAAISAQEALDNPQLLEQLNLEEYATPQVPVEVIRAVVREFRPEVRDPRGKFEPPAAPVELKPDGALRVGLRTEGVVTNITGFGAFVDIGASQDGLVHVSQLSDSYVKDPQSAVKVGDRVTVHVIAVEDGGKRISLTMKDPREALRARAAPAARSKPARRSEGPRRRRKEAGREGPPVRRTFGPDEKEKARRAEKERSLSLEEKLALLESKFRTKV